MKAKISTSLFFVLIILSVIAYAHGDVEEEINEEEIDFDSNLKSNSINYILITSLIAVISIIAITFTKDKTDKLKWLFFLAIIIPIVLTTVYMASSTIYLNLISETKGPVHWHADYEIWNCGEKIKLIEPKGLSNRIGTPVFHEHADSRMHVEGVVVDTAEVDLHNFFEVIGGSLTNDYLSVLTDERIIEISNGNLCNGNSGKLQVFLYKIKNPEDTKNWEFEQQKLNNFEDYILSPYSRIPPGDCIIIEFGEEKERTDHICETYKVAEQRGDLIGS